MATQTLQSIQQLKATRRNDEGCWLLTVKSHTLTWRVRVYNTAALLTWVARCQQTVRIG